MKKTIWKFDLEVTDKQEIEMPAEAEILSVGVQFEKPKIWALIDKKMGTVKRTFEIYGTGHDIEVNICVESRKFIGTFQMAGGSLIFHLFEILK